VTYAVLTDAGMEKFREARKAHVADIEAVFSARFSPEERTTLSALLARLLEPDDPVPACTEEPE
jgi:DNA-binding MarR family transcriptional regulator